MAEILTKVAIRNLLIVSKVYVERTIPLLEPGVGLLTDPLPKQEDAKLLVAEFQAAIKALG